MKSGPLGSHCYRQSRSTRATILGDHMSGKYNGYVHAKPNGDDSQARTRSCLTCGTPFHSEHFGNRMCDPCRAHPIEASAHTVRFYRARDE